MQATTSTGDALRSLMRLPKTVTVVATQPSIEYCGMELMLECQDWEDYPPGSCIPLEPPGDLLESLIEQQRKASAD